MVIFSTQGKYKVTAARFNDILIFGPDVSSASLNQDDNNHCSVRVDIRRRKWTRKWNQNVVTQNDLEKCVRKNVWMCVVTEDESRDWWEHHIIIWRCRTSRIRECRQWRRWGVWICTWRSGNIVKRFKLNRQLPFLTAAHIMYSKISAALFLPGSIPYDRSHRIDEIAWIETSHHV